MTTLEVKFHLTRKEAKALVRCADIVRGLVKHKRVPITRTDALNALDQLTGAICLADRTRTTKERP